MKEEAVVSSSRSFRVRVGWRCVVGGTNPLVRRRGVAPEGKGIMSRRGWLSLVAGIVVLGSSAVVIAGAKSIAPLQVNAASHYANAGLSETHNTADTTSYAECGSNSTAGYCTVRDTGGTYYSCYTTDP